MRARLCLSAGDAGPINDMLTPSPETCDELVKHSRRQRQPMARIFRADGVHSGYSNQQRHATPRKGPPFPPASAPSERSPRSAGRPGVPLVGPACCHGAVHWAGAPKLNTCCGMLTQCVEAIGAALPIFASRSHGACLFRNERHLVQWPPRRLTRIRACRWHRTRARVRAEGGALPPAVRLRQRGPANLYGARSSRGAIAVASWSIGHSGAARVQASPLDSASDTPPGQELPLPPEG